MDGSWWLFGLLWSVLVSYATYALLVVHVGTNGRHRDNDNDDMADAAGKRIHGGIGSDLPLPPTLIDLPPEMHVHILSFADRRGVVGYVGAARALRVLGHQQTLAVRPLAAIGECLCGCDEIDWGPRADHLDSAVAVGCSLECYSLHFRRLLAYGGLDDARALYRRLEVLILPAFVHLGERESRRALASWLLCHALCNEMASARGDEAAAALAHEAAGTCVFHEDIEYIESPICIGEAIERGHRACAKACLGWRGTKPGVIWDLGMTSVLYDAWRARSDTLSLDRLAARCQAVNELNPHVFADAEAVRSQIVEWNSTSRWGTIEADALAVIARHVPGLRPIDSVQGRVRLWDHHEERALVEAFVRGRWGDADRLCARASAALAQGSPQTKERIRHAIVQIAKLHLHRHVVYAADASVGTDTLAVLSRHLPRDWADSLRTALFGECTQWEACSPCSAVLHVEHLAHLDTPSFTDRNVCAALWPSPREHAQSVKGSRTRALSLLRHESVRWPVRVAFAAAAYGDLEVLDALAPERVAVEPGLSGSPSRTADVVALSDATGYGESDIEVLDAPAPKRPGASVERGLLGTASWTVDVVALLVAAGYIDDARAMASRYGVEIKQVDVAAKVAALNHTRPDKPYSGLYSADLPRCPLPLSVLLHVSRTDAKSTFIEAIRRGVGTPMHPVDAAHLAATFVGTLDGIDASRVLKPTTAVGAIDWLCGQTYMRFDAAYVTACASIGATGVVHYLVVRCGVACDVDAVRRALYDRDGRPDPGPASDNMEDGAQARVPSEVTLPPSWIDFMEPTLRAAAASARSPPVHE